MGDDNPFFLGEIRFHGFANFEWQYLGKYLNEDEVLQVINYIQDFGTPVSV